MFDAKKILYLIVVLCFLTISLPLRLWTKEGAKDRASDQQKAESQQEQAPTRDNPKISFDSHHYDAGEVWEGDEVSHTFTVKNTGTAQLNISKVRPG